METDVIKIRWEQCCIPVSLQFPPEEVEIQHCCCSCWNVAMKRSQHFDAQYLSGQSLLHRQHPAFFGNKLTRQQLYNNCPSSTQKRELLLLCLSSLSNMHYGANTTVVSPAAVKPHTCIQHCFVTTSFWRGLHVFFLCWIQTLSI